MKLGDDEMIRHIKATAYEIFGLIPDDLEEQRYFFTPIVDARRATIFAVRSLTDASYSAISRSFNVPDSESVAAVESIGSSGGVRTTVAARRLLLALREVDMAEALPLCRTTTCHPIANPRQHLDAVGLGTLFDEYYPRHGRH